MLRITAGDGQDAVDALMADGDDGGGTDLLALLFAEQEVQLVLAQAAADALSSCNKPPMATCASA